MKNVTGDLWEYGCDYRIITTNGFIKQNGEAVLGRGCAKQASQRYPGLPAQLGLKLSIFGNHVFAFPDYNLITFPVKHNWFEKASVELIAESVKELMVLMTISPFLPFADGRIPVYALPRPGCGNGQLDYSVVEPLLKALPDNVHVITNEVT